MVKTFHGPSLFFDGLTFSSRTKVRGSYQVTSVYLGGPFSEVLSTSYYNLDTSLKVIFSIGYDLRLRSTDLDRLKEGRTESEYGGK